MLTSASRTSSSHRAHTVTDSQGYHEARELSSEEISNNQPDGIIEDESYAVPSNPNDGSRVLEPIAEDEEDLRASGIPEMDRRRSTGKFPVLKFHQDNTNRDSVAMRTISERDRRDTFRPPFDPNSNKYDKDRNNEENFTFSKKEVHRNLKSAENPFKGILLQMQAGQDHNQ